MFDDYLAQLFKNKILLSAFIAWAFAQGVKISVSVCREKKFDFKWLIRTGGMPSAHSAGVSALATAIGVTVGFNSGLFALALVFAIVIMFDAQSVRREAGKQAGIINKLMSENKSVFQLQEEKLMELLGHTPIEVIAGAVLGILIALIYL